MGCRSKTVAFYDVLSLCLCFFGFDDFPNAGCEDCTYERAYDEYPKFAKGFTAFEESRTNGTCGVHAGAGEVDAYQVDKDECQADSQTSEVVGGAVGFAGSTEHNQYEQSREHYFYEHTVHCAESAGVSARGCSNNRAFTGCNYCVENCGSEASANHLEQDIAKAIFCTDFANEEHTKRDGGVNMATADATNGVGHGHYRKTEGNGCADNGGRISSVTTQGYSCAATQERKYERTYQFC